jgi:DNA-binding response OmpR family regulator
MLTAMPRVLLVDDDPAILRLLEVNFRMEGFDVDAAAHGEDALAAASAMAPDAVILDLMMPGLDGREILRRLRAEPATAEVPVVFLSARGRDDALVAGTGEIFVQKPFDTVALVATIRELVEGSSR